MESSPPTTNTHQRYTYMRNIHRKPTGNWQKIFYITKAVERSPYNQIEWKQTNKKQWDGTILAPLEGSCEEERGKVYTGRFILGTLILGTFPLPSGKSAEIDWLESPGVCLIPGNHGRDTSH